MAERLVDVKRSGGAILHVYRVTIPAEIVSDADYEKKALMADLLLPEKVSTFTDYLVEAEFCLGEYPAIIAKLR